MAILDALNLFDGAQSAAGSYSGAAITTTTASTNIIDLGVARDLGNNDDTVEILCQIMTTFTGGTSMAVSIQGSADNSTYVDLAMTPAVLTAALTAGKELLRIKLPRIQNGVALPRYLRLYYTVVGTMTAGAVFAGLIIDRANPIAYPNNYSTTYI